MRGSAKSFTYAEPSIGLGISCGGSLKSSAPDVSDVDTIQTKGNRKMTDPSAMIVTRVQATHRGSIPIMHPPPLEFEL